MADTPDPHTRERVPNIPNETNETAHSRESAIDATVPTVSNGPLETIKTLRRLGASYRVIGKTFGKSATTLWRWCNRDRSTTDTREHRSQRITNVYVGRYVHGWSIRRIATELACSRSAVERDLQHIECLRARGVDVDAIAQRHIGELTGSR